MASTLDKFLTKPSAPKPQAGTVHWLDECIERSKSGPFYEIAILTPGLAAELLRRNPDNRNITPSHQAKLVSEIRADRWQLNLVPIIISVTGEVNDGQNRCQAVIDANRPIPAAFGFGATRESRFTVDLAQARTAAHFLAMRGLVNASTAAGIARLVLAYERSGGQNIAETKLVTTTEVDARAFSDEGIQAAAAFAQRRAQPMSAYCAPSPIGACYYILSKEHPNDAAAFMKQVCEGENIKKSDPAFAVRERLLTSGRHAGPKMEVIFRGWNAYRSGRPLKIAKVFGNFPALVD